MPNHVKNSLSFKGKKKHIDQMLEKFGTHVPRAPKTTHDGHLIFEVGDGDWTSRKVYWLNEETGVITTRGERDIIEVLEIPEEAKQLFNEAFFEFPDFNKIIPMPESLHIESGSNTSIGMAIIEGDKSGEDIFSLPFGESQKRFYERSVDERIEMLKKGIQAIENKKNHGYTDWYNWSIDHWGTKWGGYSFAQEKIGEIDSYVFETAWSAPHPVIEELSKQNPFVEILHQWADEDTGYNCGVRSWLAGEILDENIPEGGSRKAYDIAFLLRPENERYYKLVDGTYEYDEESE